MVQRKCRSEKIFQINQQHFSKETEKLLQLENLFQKAKRRWSENKQETRQALFIHKIMGKWLLLTSSQTAKIVTSATNTTHFVCSCGQSFNKTFADFKDYCKTNADFCRLIGTIADYWRLL